MFLQSFHVLLNIHDIIIRRACRKENNSSFSVKTRSWDMTFNVPAVISCSDEHTWHHYSPCLFTKENNFSMSMSMSMSTCAVPHFLHFFKNMLMAHRTGQTDRQSDVQLINTPITTLIPATTTVLILFMQRKSEVNEQHIQTAQITTHLS